MLRLLALALSLLFFWAGGFSGAVDVVGLAGGAFFMILFLGTFLPASHAVIALGGALCAMALMWLAMGKITLSRYAVPADMEAAPLAFWIKLAVLLGCGVALLVGGIAHAWAERGCEKESESHGKEVS